MILFILYLLYKNDSRMHWKETGTNFQMAAFLEITLELAISTFFMK